MKKVLKEILKKLKLYDSTKKLIMKRKESKRLTSKYTFESRMKGNEKVCFILAGYKDFCYDIVFGRIKKFVPKDVEVCILSSGKYSEELSNIAKENDWSYLSTKRNNVCLIQNVANSIYKDAKYIYKIDEDIFITKNFFNTLFKTYESCEQEGDYNVGLVAPMIPINGFSHVLILDRFNLREKFEKKFEKIKYAAGPDRMIENNPEVAKFFWGEDKIVPNIDEIDNIVSKDPFAYVACPIRFSIGAIMYSRKLWSDIGMFPVGSGADMGNDEIYLCFQAMKNSKGIIISKNTAVGHLSFGKQNKTMEKYFKDNKKVFDIHNVK